MINNINNAHTHYTVWPIFYLFCFSMAFELFPPLNPPNDLTDVLPPITDLDPESTSLSSLSNITYHTISNRLRLTLKYFQSLINHNPKTVIYITDTNTLIAPIDEVLMHDNPSNLSTLTYLEIKHRFKKRVKYNYIPVSPCISSRTFQLDQIGRAHV